MVQGLSQHWESYETHHHETWEKLYNRQRKNLKGKASELYLTCLDKMQGSLTSDLVPRVDAMEAELHAATGWRLRVVPGLIPVQDFFELLADKRFCTSTWVRQPHQLDYIEEPDMFHDTFGHIPPLLNGDFAAFMHRFGEIGMALLRAGHHDAVLGLQRLYWYVVEFGFLKNPDGETKVFGAGIMSSFGETEHAWSRRFKLNAFDLSRVMETSFRTDEIQQEYFVVNDLVQLRHELNGWFDQFDLTHG